MEKDTEKLVKISNQLSREKVWEEVIRDEKLPIIILAGVFAVGAGIMCLEELGFLPADTTLDDNLNKETSDENEIIGNELIIQTFEPGTHIIKSYITSYERRYKGKSPHTPEGYELLDYQIRSYALGGRDSFDEIYVFVNNETVEAIAVYDEKSEKYTYPNAGHVVKQLVKNK